MKRQLGSAGRRSRAGPLAHPGGLWCPRSRGSAGRPCSRRRGSRWFDSICWTGHKSGRAPTSLRASYSTFPRPLRWVSGRDKKRECGFIEVLEGSAGFLVNKRSRDNVVPWNLLWSPEWTQLMAETNLFEQRGCELRPDPLKKLKCMYSFIKIKVKRYCHCTRGDLTLLDVIRLELLHYALGER